VFVTYLMRELRRRLRQAIFIAAGLALGVGLVITVAAASDGVTAAQGTVLQSLYGVGTDITVTQPPTAGSGGGTHFNFGAEPTQRGTSVSQNVLVSGGLGTMKSSSVTTVAKQADVAAAVGSLVLNDVTLSGKVSATGGASAASPGGVASGNFNTNSFSVTGVDPSNDALGPLNSGAITSGHGLTVAEADENVAVVDANYAKSENLKTGSKITVAGKSFTVVGIVQPAEGVTGTDVYIPLARAQALADMPDEVNTIYVSASSAADVAGAAAEISRALPAATVTTSSDLANDITGSLSSASTLAKSLGKWLVVAVLVVAFCLASILTVSAVSRRIREFGTLKAMGWASRRIVLQVIGEALVIGAIGGLAGIAVGYGAAAIVRAVAPPLSATVSGAPGSGPGAAGGFARSAASAAHTVSVHLTTPVGLGVVALAVLLGIAGALIAGSIGGWRAARLHPSAALSSVE
jgi:ABC-type lipoprotein release transport system permease subunit